MNYSIHGILKIETNVGVPIPDYFRVEKILAPDLTILSKKRLDFEKPKDNKILKGNYYFWGDDQKLFVDYGIMNAKLSIEDLFGYTKVECTTSLKRFCTQESWERLIFAILSVKLIQKGYTFVHAGCLSHHGEGILIVAMQDTGKTSTVLSLLDGKEFKFLGDDFAIIGKNGITYSYPKKVRLSPRTLGGKVISPQGALERKFLRSRMVSTFIERFTKRDITRLLRVPEIYVVDKCPVGKIFVLSGYGEERAVRMDKRKAFDAITTLSLQMPNLIETYLDMYYHLFHINVAGVLEEKNKIIKRAVNAANCFEVTASNLEGYSRAMRKVMNSN